MNKIVEIRLGLQQGSNLKPQLIETNLLIGDA
jgi:hypothetical protein